MKPAVAPLFLVIALITFAHTQDAAKAPAQSESQPEAKSVTVPITLDHARIVIDVYLTLPDWTTKRVRAWVDNGNPDLYLSRRLATLMGLNVSCDDKNCSAPPPADITIGSMRIPLAGIKEAKIPLKPVAAAAIMAPGMSAEINLPSSLLRNYDVLVSFPDREFSIGLPGTIPFRGAKNKVLISAENGLIQVPSKVENKNYNLALDLGASISFLSSELFEKSLAAHSDWPHMTGAVGPANMWGLDAEAQWKLMRLDRLQFGTLFLTDVPMVDFPKEAMAWFEKRAGMPTSGLIGAQALLNYRVGLDYAHSTVYFEVGSTFKFPDFDVVGLVLRPENDGRFTILGAADFDGKPSVPEVQAGDHLLAVDNIPVPESTMGQVWSMLGGSPGQERRLTIEHQGKQLTVVARVQHFLGEAPDDQDSKGKSKKK
jgi:hypothetical protein